MCKRVIVGGVLLMVLTVSFSAVGAQTPYIAAFFDTGDEQKDCPGMGVLDSLQVFLLNTNKSVVGVDFAIDYPPSVIHLADLNLAGNVTIGSTPLGFSMGWDSPQNGFFPIRIVTVLVQWNCIACERPNDPIIVIPNRYTGDLAYVDWPAFDLFPVIGLTSLACPTIATEETTWGNIKALYKE